LETASLEYDSCLLEVGAVVTDAWLNELGTYHAFIRHPLADIERDLSDWTRVVHRQAKYVVNPDDNESKRLCSLVDMCVSDAARNLTNVETELKALVTRIMRQNDKMCNFYLAGSTPHFDKSVIERQLPELNAVLSFRIIDVTMLQILSMMWAPSLNAGRPPNMCDHTAMADVRSSLDLMRYYKWRLFAGGNGRHPNGTSPHATTVHSAPALETPLLPAPRYYGGRKHRRLVVTDQFVNFNCRRNN
jgi:oligoribonuclease